MPTRRRRRVALLGLLSLAGLISLTACSGVSVTEVRATSDDLAIEVALDTCNADVSVHVEEYHDRVVVHAERHDRHFFLSGSDDCQDVVRVDLEQRLGNRTIMNSSGAELVVTR